MHSKRPLIITADGSGAIIRWDIKELAAVLRPFEEFLEELKADPELTRRDEMIVKFNEIRAQYDEGTLRDKRVFYTQWQCKKILGLLKTTVRKS